MSLQKNQYNNTTTTWTWESSHILTCSTAPTDTETNANLQFLSDFQIGIMTDHKKEQKLMKWLIRLLPTLETASTTANENAGKAWDLCLQLVEDPLLVMPSLASNRIFPHANALKMFHCRSNHLHLLRLHNLTLPYVLLTTRNQANMSETVLKQWMHTHQLQFPVIIKPETRGEHDHIVVSSHKEWNAMLNDNGLFAKPRVVQNFIPHGNCIYKVSVMGKEDITVQLRHTILGQDVRVHSIVVEKPSKLPMTTASVLQRATARNVVETLAAQLVGLFEGIELFNFDVIVTSNDVNNDNSNNVVNNKKIWVVDVNLFPGYPFKDSDIRMIRWMKRKLENLN